MYTTGNISLNNSKSMKHDLTTDQKQSEHDQSSLIKSQRSKGKPPMIVCSRISDQKKREREEPVFQLKKNPLYANVPSRVYEIKPKKEEPSLERNKSQK